MGKSLSPYSEDPKVLREIFVEKFADDYYVREALIRNSNLPHDIMEAIIYEDSNHIYVRSLASNSGLPPYLQSIIAQRSDAEARICLLLNDELHPKVLKLLERDSDFEISNACLTKKPDVSWIILDDISKYPNRICRELVAAHKDIQNTTK
jgi:hypothetical protein